MSSQRLGLWGESAAIAVFAVVSLFFPGSDAGGSGYLGAFIAGLIVGNMEVLRLGMHPNHEPNMRSLVANLSDVMVILVFVTLGANLPFDTIADEWVPALAVMRRSLVRRSPDGGSGSACCRTGAAAGRVRRSSSSAGHARPASCRPRSPGSSSPRA